MADDDVGPDPLVAQHAADIGDRCAGADRVVDLDVKGWQPSRGPASAR